MSAKTWIKEFYRTEADDLATRSGDVKLLQHSIKKWSGALPTNLKRHDLEKPPIYFDSDNCALCVRYADEPDCPGCPLSEHRKGTSCAHERDHEEESPYGEWVYRKDPRPMLKLLRAALRKARAK